MAYAPVTDATLDVLLAVDIGVRTGLAVFGPDGRLRWYHSQNFGAAARLRRGVHGILASIPRLSWLILEGGGPLADLWQHEAQRRGIAVQQISAEVWRQQLLHPRQQRRGTDAKEHADTVARRVIAWSGARRPVSLRHDAAEAILIGLWGVLAVGWLPALPEALQRLRE